MFTATLLGTQEPGNQNRDRFPEAVLPSGAPAPPTRTWVIAASFGPMTERETPAPRNSQQANR